MAEDDPKKPPAIFLEKPEDIKKLVGCSIINARVVSIHGGVCIEFDINHIMAPNPVSVRIEPKAETIIDEPLAGLVIHGDGLPIKLRNTLVVWTKDIKQK